MPTATVRMGEDRQKSSLLVQFAPKYNFRGFFVAEFSKTELMQRTFSLALKGRGRTLPNPMVGAVLTKNGRIIAEGYHKGPGYPHAEIEAIGKAGKNAKGATLYVNLEPCCHFGRTGPCTEAITEAGIKRVVYAATDPNPLVKGRGAKILKKAGIEVTNGLLSTEAARLNEVYFGLLKNERPFVTLKLAQSLDGRIATIDGDSKWISGEKSRKFAHSLRAESGAVLVGMGTVRKDNPSLTVRHVRGKNPYRIIVSTSGDLPKSTRLISENQDLKTILATTHMSIPKSANSRSKKMTYWTLEKAANGEIDLADLLQKAKAFGIHSILVEGGAEIAASFLKDKLVDKLILITAPIIVGKGVDAIGDLGLKRIDQAITFKDSYRFQSGPDEVFVGYPEWSK